MVIERRLYRALALHRLLVMAVGQQKRHLDRPVLRSVPTNRHGATGMRLLVLMLVLVQLPADRYVLRVVPEVRVVPVPQYGHRLQQVVVVVVHRRRLVLRRRSRTRQRDRVHRGRLCERTVVRTGRGRGGDVTVLQVLVLVWDQQQRRQQFSRLFGKDRLRFGRVINGG